MYESQAIVTRTLSPLELALLGLVAREPSSGYALRKLFQAAPMNAFSDSPGSIYPALRRLEASKLVGGAVAGGRRRQVLRATAAGRAMLVGWLTAPVTQADVASASQAELSLRLAFMSDVAPRHVRVFLREYARALQAYADAVDDGLRLARKELSVSAALAVELGLYEIRNRATWCRRASQR